MVLTQDRWALYWKDKNDPQHSSSDDAHYDAMARELLALLGPPPVGAVLELACGNGVFYKRLGFARARYLGVDFSPTMLAKFREAHPQVRLEAADVRCYIPAEPADLIFSNGLLQYLSAPEIDRHLGSVRNSLKPSGRILHAAVPWDWMRWPYYSGMLKVARQGRIKSSAVYLSGRCGLLRSTMGYWHSVATIRNIAARHELETTFYGSLYYPYRFHVRMVPRAR